MYVCVFMHIDTSIKCGYLFIYSARLLYKGNAVSSKIEICFTVAWISDAVSVFLLACSLAVLVTRRARRQGPPACLSHWCQCGWAQRSGPSFSWRFLLPGSVLWLPSWHHLSLSLILLACRDSATPSVEHQHTTLCSLCSFTAEGFECIPRHR